MFHTMNPLALSTCTVSLLPFSCSRSLFPVLLSCVPLVPYVPTPGLSDLPRFMFEAIVHGAACASCFAFWRGLVVCGWLWLWFVVVCVEVELECERVCGCGPWSWSMVHCRDSRIGGLGAFHLPPPRCCVLLVCARGSCSCSRLACDLGGWVLGMCVCAARGPIHCARLLSINLSPSHLVTAVLRLPQRSTPPGGSSRSGAAAAAAARCGGCVCTGRGGNPRARAGVSLMPS